MLPILRLLRFPPYAHKRVWFLIVSYTITFYVRNPTWKCSRAFVMEINSSDIWRIIIATRCTLIAYINSYDYIQIFLCFPEFSTTIIWVIRYFSVYFITYNAYLNTDYYEIKWFKRQYNIKMTHGTVYNSSWSFYKKRFPYGITHFLVKLFFFNIFKS